jgi:hypothetical protein
MHAILEPEWRHCFLDPCNVHLVATFKNVAVLGCVYTLRMDYLKMELNIKETFMRLTFYEDYKLATMHYS